MPANVLASFTSADSVCSTALLAGYAAARPTPTTKQGGRIGTNTNSTYAGLQRVGMGFTAEMVTKDNPIAAAYLGHRQNYCSSVLTYIPATGDSGLDRDITTYLHGGDGFGGVFATMGVDCSMQDAFMRTADLETPVRGDAGLILWRPGDHDPVRLIEFSADQLGEIWQFTSARKCGLVRSADGRIEETADGQITYLAGRYFRGADCVAYKIYERTNAWYSNPVIYDASDIIYFRDPASFRGVRGVTFFANALAHMQKAEDLLQAAIASAQRQARTYGRVFNESGQAEDLNYETGPTGNITFFEKLPGAPIEEYFYTGDSAEFVSPNTPSPEIIAGIEAADERVALALRINYAFLISATKVGGAPGRLEVEKADKEFRRIQNTIHRPRLRRIADIVLMDAVNRRELIPPRGMTSDTFKHGRWMLPISPSVDAFYDAKENIDMVREGLEAPQDVIAETNRDARDVVRRKGEWRMWVEIETQKRNKELVELGYKPNIQASEISGTSDNPQQAAAAENIEEGKPAAGGSGAGVPDGDVAKLSAMLAEWDESKHKRGQPGNAGEFGPGGDGGTATKEKKETKAAPKPSSSASRKAPEPFNFKGDMRAQAEWMNERAKSLGHEGINDLLSKSPDVVKKWSKEWRAKHPRTDAPSCDDRCQRAKLAHVMVDKTIQRYAEEHNEPRMAKALGGVSFPNSEPIDIAIAGDDGVVKHGIELKTVVKNSNAKITMKGDAIARKRAWERKNKAQIHTVVVDDTAVFNALGDGKHDESKRKIYYRRGYGSFRIGGMHPVKDLNELKTLLDTPTRKLPPAAK